MTDIEIKDPPDGILASLRYMGPGLILSAAIVGSGELIATSSLGAKAGFALLWVIVLGCMVKVAVQLEYGRFCIHYGLPTFQAWNHTGRRRICNIHWTIYAGVLFMVANCSGQGGVLGGAAQVLHHWLPALSTEVCVCIVVFLVGLLVSQGRYLLVERVATLLNLMFILGILFCVYWIRTTPYAFSTQDLLRGLSFRFPPDTIGLAIAAFGITGVAAGEIAMYPYWCLEKGYACWTGPKDDSPQWYQRARGWTRVMTLDAVVSMLVYTIATAAFYVLGAAVLRAQDALADGNQFILQLSSLFTEVLGGRAQVVFMLCAFAVLFSTIFANTASFSRMWVDVFGLCKWLDWNDDQRRYRAISRMAWVFAVVCGAIYLFVQKPLLLVVIMGVTNSLFLIVVAYQAIIFRYQFSDPQLKPSKCYDMALWISLTSIGLLAIRTVYSLITKLVGE